MKVFFYSIETLQFHPLQIAIVLRSSTFKTKENEIFQMVYHANKKKDAPLHL